MRDNTEMLFKSKSNALLEKLILQYNKEFYSEVQRIVNKHHQQIRNVISDKTGLSLTNKTLKFSEFENNPKNAVIHIKVTDKIPVTLSEILEKHSLKIIELLFHYKKMKIAYNEIVYQINNYESYTQYHNNYFSKSDIDKTKNYLKKLISEIENSGIIEDLKRINPNSTGGYDSNTNTVEIFWLSIGLYSVVFELPMEHITLINLIHELVHGYTQNGFDIDGNQWDINSFNKADRRITEGFAQHYTYHICKNHFNYIIPTFNEFYHDSSSEYILYKDWFSEKDKNIYEITRTLLLNTRSKNITNYQIFLKELNKIKQESLKQGDKSGRNK